MHVTVSHSSTCSEQPEGVIAHLLTMCGVCPCVQVLLPLLKTLKEVNMEFTVVDGRTFTTGHSHAMIR